MALQCRNNEKFVIPKNLDHNDNFDYILSPLKMNIQTEYTFPQVNQKSYSNKLTTKDKIIQLLGKTRHFVEQICECGLDTDIYETDVYFSGLGFKKQEVHRQNADKQITENNSLEHIWQGTKLVSDKCLKNLMNNFKNSSLNSSSLGLHLKFPTTDKAFEYTVAIATNNLYEGLLHSLVRHWNQWQIVVPKLCEILSKLEPRIQIQLKKIENALNKKSCEMEIEELLREFSKLENETFFDVYFSMFDAQLQIYKFIRSTIANFTNYSSEGVDFKDHIKTHFKVEDNDEEIEVMVIPVSNHLYPAAGDFGDNRPIRNATTVYFISEEDYLEEINADEESEEEEFLSDDQKREVINKHRSLADQAEYRKSFPGSMQDISPEEIDQINKLNLNPDLEISQPNKNSGVVLKKHQKTQHLHVRMPSEFGYTCAMLTNSFKKGLLHTFARHWEDYSAYIPSIYNIRFKRLSLISDEIRAIHYSSSPKIKEQAYKNAEIQIAATARDQIPDLMYWLRMAQLVIFKYIQDKVTFGHYRGEGIFSKSQIQVYFQTHRNARKVLTVCLDCKVFPTTGQLAKYSNIADFVIKINTNFYTREYRILDKIWPKSILTIPCNTIVST